MFKTFIVVILSRRVTFSVFYFSPSTERPPQTTIWRHVAKIVDNPYAPVSPPYLKKIVRIPALSILPLQSLENLIFSLDPLQSLAVRAPRKKYVSVVSLGIAYRSRRETSFHTRVFHPPWPRFTFPENSPPKHDRSNNDSLDQHPPPLDNRIAF